MLKPIRTTRLKTVGLGMRFARGITERAAAVGSYDLSESELVFAMGAARERDDLMSVLELLDEVLDLIRRGFDRRANVLAVRIINNVGIMLSRGGFSREYFNTADICNKISAAVYGKTENFNISECRAEIHKQISLLRAEQEKQTSGSRQKNTPRFAGTNTLKLFNKISERGTLTVNTLNSGLLRIMTRNPELLKMLRADKTFMELSLKNIENVRRRTERAMTVQRFFDALTADQIKLLDRFVVNENLFSEIREKSSVDHDLKYLLENSSEKSLSEFFETLKQKTEERSGLLSEKRYFNSVEEMKEFFVRARRSEIERLIKELEKDRLYRSEARTLTDALRLYGLYEIKTEKRSIADEKSAELYRIAETALRHKLGEENFSVERFIGSLKTSNELKKFFADYAWENYRSDETVKRFTEYMKNALSVSENDHFGLEQAESRVIPDISEFAAHGGSEISNAGVTAAENGATVPSVVSADGITKESFADFLINSGELSLKFSESVRNSFLNASPDVAAAFAEYLVNTVREDDHAFFGERIRSLAEKTENILYYEDSDIEKKSAETFSLIYSAWNESASQLSELYASFTQSRDSHDEILKLYSYLPKNNYTAVSEFLKAAAQGDAYFISLSDDFLKQSDNIPNNTGETFDSEKKAHEYTFYDALNNMSENTLSLLLPLAGIRGESGSVLNESSYINAYSSHRGNNAADHSPRGNSATDGSPRGNNAADSSTLVEQTSAFVISAAFAEYLSGTVLGDGSDHYSERIRVLAERVENVLRKEGSDAGEAPDILERSAEALALIYNEWNSDSAQLSEIYKSFTEKSADREEILRLYSRLPQNDFAGISDILNSEMSGGANFFGLNSVFFKQPEKLFERMSSFTNITNAAHYTNAKFDNERDIGGAHGETLENESELILAVNDTRGESTGGTETAKYGAFSELREAKELYQRLASSGIRPLLPSVSSRSEHRIYNIAQTENRPANKSIVTDKAFYKALTAFSGATENITYGILNSSFSEIAYPARISSSPRGYFFTWENESVTLFNRAAANKTRIRTNGFFEKHSTAALTLSERISGKFSAENQRSDHNTAVELFYTDEYFENSGIGAAGTPVNYAIPAPAASGGSDEVSEKLGNIHETIENINTEITQIKQREQELSCEFVTKSEQKVFERELKSSIERDIYLAGKRHGIY